MAWSGQVKPGTIIVRREPDGATMFLMTQDPPMVIRMVETDRITVAVSRPMTCEDLSALNRELAAGRGSVLGEEVRMAIEGARRSLGCPL